MNLMVRPCIVASARSLLAIAASLGIWGTVSPAIAMEIGAERDRLPISEQLSDLPSTDSPHLAETPQLLSQFFGEVLQLGDEGSEVVEIQSQLSQLGFYTGAIDGIFGPGTETAVLNFQESYGLQVDGVVGAETRATLASAAGAGNPVVSPGVDSALLQRGDTGPAVTELQQQLRQLGFYFGEISGEFGTRTEDGVRSFQRSAGLEEDGIVGPATQTALRAALASPAATVPSTPPASTPPPTSSAPVAAQSFDAQGRYSIFDLQERLQERGFYSGPIDGIEGEGTRSAIDAAQDAYDLQPGDVVDLNFGF